MRNLTLILFLSLLASCYCSRWLPAAPTWTSSSLLHAAMIASGGMNELGQGEASSSDDSATPQTSVKVMSEQQQPDTNIEQREVVIIGSGPSGCTAAIYAGRAMLKPLVIAGYTAGGQLMLTSDVENFPGYRNPVGGPEMMEDLTLQAKRFGADFVNVNCAKVDLSKRPFTVTMSNNKIVQAQSLIISTGAEALWTNIEAEENFKGKGISTCATCDGYMFRDKEVVVMGGGDSAMEEAIFLTRFASTVHVIHRRDTFRASKLMLQRAKSNPKIKFHTNRQTLRWNGEDGVLSAVTLKNIVDGSIETLECSGAFIAIGHRPNTKFLDGQLELDEGGYIVTKKHTMTSVEGVFACGDVVDKRYKQAITAAGSGCQAAIDAERWLEEIHGTN